MSRSAVVLALAAMLALPPAVQAQIRRGPGGPAGHRGQYFPSRMGWRVPGPIGGPIRGPLPYFPSFAFGLSRSSFFFPHPMDYYPPVMVPAPIYITPVHFQPAYSPVPETASKVSQSELELAYQVGRLTQEVEQLRQEQALHAVQQPVPAPAPVQNQPAAPSNPRVLVLRDGRRLEFRNYAIVGQTVWILDGNISAKFSLADLNLPATQKENLERGVRCPLLWDQTRD